MKIISRGTVFSGSAEADLQSCTFPYICVLPTGRWLCSFRAAPTKLGTIGQRPMIVWSDNEGASWSEPLAPFTAPSLDGKPGVFRVAALTSIGSDSVLAALNWVDHSNPKLAFFNEQTEGLLDTRIFFSTSEDAGASWSEARIMNTAPFEVPTPLTGPVLVLPDGSWACQLELNKHYYENSIWKHRSVMMFSRDGGRTWPEHVYTSQDPDNRIFYWDQRPSMLTDGRLLVLFWTYDIKEAVYLNIHARESFDNGRTWSDIWDTAVPGQPAPAVLFPNKLISMVYVDRTSSPAIKARISSDMGRTWPQESELVISETNGASQICNRQNMQDAWAEMGAFSMGLPATSPLPNGEFLTVFYSGSKTDQTEIQYVRLAYGRPNR